MAAKHLHLSVMVILATALQAWAEHPLQPVLEQAREEHNVSAIGAIAIIDGEISEPCVVGVIGNGMTTVVPADARWHLGSCSKSITAMLVAVMVERDDLLWEQTLGESFADTDIEVNPD